MNTPRHENLLRNFQRNGVYRAPVRGLDALLEAAGQAGLAGFRIDLAGVTDRPELLKRFAAPLNFPDWYGQNWDALADCLADLSWIEAEGYLFLLENADDLRSAHPDEFITMLQVFAAVTESWREAGIPFWIFVDLQADGIAYLPGIG